MASGRDGLNAPGLESAGLQSAGLESAGLESAGLESAGLAADLGELGLAGAPGILVQSSLRKIGRLVDGPATLFAALRAAAGPESTVVVQTHTANNSLSSRDFRAATAGLSPAGVAAHIDALPGFDAATTPSYRMGAFAEYVRRRPDAVRSQHPQTSFAAAGPAAAAWMSVHDLDCHLGRRSPLGALAAAGGRVLLIGVGLADCTAFHLGEYLRRGPKPVFEYRCFVQEPGGRRLLRYTDVHLIDEDFGALGADFVRSAGPAEGKVGATLAMTFPVRTAAEFAARWMDSHRAGAPG